MIQVRQRRRRQNDSCWQVNLRIAILSVAMVAMPGALVTRADGVVAQRRVVASYPDAPSVAASFDELAGIETSLVASYETESLPEEMVFDGHDATAAPCVECEPAAWCGRPHCNRPDPDGLIQRLHDHHSESGACWVARADALLLWRDSPPARPLIEAGTGAAIPILDANQLNSTATGGVRGSLWRVDDCTGHAWELAYLYAGNFTAQRALPYVNGFPYTLSPPGIYGNNAGQPFDSGTVKLLATLQSAELNRHFASGPNFRWLAGFRWLQWQEQFALQDRLDDGVNFIDDFYSTDCMNNLFGGQIGADACLLTLGWLRVDSVVKAGAYYNEAGQTSRYTVVNAGTLETASAAVWQSPAACSFVGEVGITGLVPISRNLDFRFGYLGLWLTGLAQPTQQLSGQEVNPGFPTAGTLTTNGGTLLQGLTLGLEGRW